MQLAAISTAPAFRPPPRYAGFTDALVRVQQAREDLTSQHYTRAQFQLGKATMAVSYGAMLLDTTERTYENVNRFMHASQDIGFALGHLGWLVSVPQGTPDPNRHLEGAYALLDAAEQALRELPSQ
ncbi:MAG: hypothetical protein JWN72_885 [Thermoleophilia bacterium]|nr:hypothetical protein [Thermoleophilia bacterium]